MDAEITNTPYPGNSLNPCRICHLAAPTQIGKHEKDYVERFFEIDSDGNQKANDRRVWGETIQRTHDLFKIIHERTTDEYDTMSKVWGVKDRINERLTTNKSKTAVKAKLKHLKDNHFSRLFNPFLTLEGSIFLPFRRL